MVCTGKNIPGKTEHFFHYFTSSEDGEEDGEEEKGAVSYDEVFLYLSDKKYSCSDDSRKRAIRSKAAGFITADGVLITREKNSIEPRRWIRDLEPRMQILKSCHHGLEGGHFGRDKTRSKISARYYWQGLAKVFLGIFSLARIFRPENLYWRNILAVTPAFRSPCLCLLTRRTCLFGSVSCTVLMMSSLCSPLFTCVSRGAATLQRALHRRKSFVCHHTTKTFWQRNSDLLAPLRECSK